MTTKWADVEDDGDFEDFEDHQASDGVTHRPIFKREQNDALVKYNQEVRVTTVKTRVNKAVIERAQTFREFGASFVCPVNEGIEDVALEFTRQKKGVVKDMDDDDDDAHLMDSIPRRTDLQRKFKEVTSKDEVVIDDPTDAPPINLSRQQDDDAAPGKYVAPSMRGGGGHGRSMQDHQKEECTVRVTNLSEETTEKDISDLFDRMGPIQRVYLAKHREKETSRGFAFVTYRRKEDAEKAISRLNRHGFDSLLLNVEWAKPSNKNRD